MHPKSWLLIRTACRTAAALWLWVMLACAAQAEAPRHDLPLWKIEGSENHLYLLGSVHMLRESDYPLPPELYDAYADADRLIMELDVTAVEPVATQLLVKELGMIADKKELADLLGADAYAEAQRLADRIDIPLSMLAGSEPWFAAITIDALLLMRHGFSPANGIEMRFSESAAADGKPISGLETERQQLEMLDALSPQAQSDLLLQTLMDGEKVESSMDALIDAWRHGDTESLESDLLREIRKYPEIYQTLVVRRNEDWVKQIVELLDDGQNYLIIVGAMHLIGDSGVPALMREKGYPVEQLRDSH
jgi:uncharacterized protein YbaP (TraB family)